MRYKIDNDLHIHSKLSSCSNDEAQSTERILQYAIDNHLSTVCVTNHYWDASVAGASRWYTGQDFAHLSLVKPLPTARGVRMLIGCEADMTRDGRLTIPAERYDDFDLILVSLTHFNHSHLAIPTDAPARERAKLWADRLAAVLDMPLPFHKVGLASAMAVVLLLIIIVITIIQKLFFKEER
jgi:histidinol phosphatase-like PHP family hydrolase